MVKVNNESLQVPESDIYLTTLFVKLLYGLKNLTRFNPNSVVQLKMILPCSLDTHSQEFKNISS